MKKNMVEVCNEVVEKIGVEYEKIKNGGERWDEKFLDEIYNILKNSNYEKIWLEGEVEVNSYENSVEIIVGNKNIFENDEERWGFNELIEFLDIFGRDEIELAIMNMIAAVDQKLMNEYKNE